MRMANWTLACLLMGACAGATAPAATPAIAPGVDDAEREADERETVERVAGEAVEPQANETSAAARRVCARFALAFRPGCEAFHSANYETAATALLDAVNSAPEHEDSALSLWMVAQAFGRLERHESRDHTFQRIIDELGPRTSPDPARDELLTGILGEAYMSLGLQASEGEHYEQALSFFRPLADAQRFSRSTNEHVQLYRRDAMVNVALLLEILQRHPEAIQAAQRIMAESTPQDEIWQEAQERILRLSPPGASLTP